MTTSPEEVDEQIVAYQAAGSAGFFDQCRSPRAARLDNFEVIRSGPVNVSVLPLDQLKALWHQA